MGKTRYLSQTSCDSFFSAFHMIWKEQMAYLIPWVLTTCQGSKREKGKRGRRRKTEENKLLCSGLASTNAPTYLLAPLPTVPKKKKKFNSIRCWEWDAHLPRHPQEEKTKKQATKRFQAADRYTKTSSVCRNSKPVWLWWVKGTMTAGLQITTRVMTRQVCNQNRSILTDRMGRWVKWAQAPAGLSISGRVTLQQERPKKPQSFCGFLCIK